MSGGTPPAAGNESRDWTQGEERRAQALFEILDVNCAGSISTGELLDMHGGDGEGLLRSMLEKNQNGVIAGQEWLTWLQEIKQTKGPSRFLDFLWYLECLAKLTLDEPPRQETVGNDIGPQRTMPKPAKQVSQKDMPTRP